MRTIVKSALLCIATLVPTEQTHADPTYTYFRQADGTRAISTGDPTLWNPRSGFRAYDNWRTSTEGGNSRLRARYRTGEHEIADDVTLTTVAASQLSDIGYSVWNGSTASTLSSYRITVRFYNAERTLLGEDTDLWSISIAPQTGIAIFSEGGFYRPFGIVLPTQIFMSIQFSEIQGIAPEDIGVTLSGPRTTGYSSAFAQNFTTGQQVNFDGTDQTNIKFFVDTVDAPGPGTPLVAGAAILLTTRRRR